MKPPKAPDAPPETALEHPAVYQTLSDMFWSETAPPDEPARGKPTKRRRKRVTTTARARVMPSKRARR
jgi:hypothetical protein